MLRHFKMEMLKRQQEELMGQSLTAELKPAATMPTEAAANQLVADLINHHRPLKQQQQQQQEAQKQTQQQRKQTQHRQQQQQQRLSKHSASKQETAHTDRAASRARNRRASKPQMEKRRRARINECLDILKSYVLTDSTNLTHLGIDPAASENQDEETIARTILKSSGLIHRHRGRKNPNKLEKADILELTVDYVRRLHEQRNELLNSSESGPTIVNNQCPSNVHGNQVIDLKVVRVNEKRAHAQTSPPQLLVPAHLSEPLTLDLSSQSRLALRQHHCCDLLAQGQPHGAPLTPPPSSASSVQSGLSVGGQESYETTSAARQIMLSRVFDNYKLYDSYVLQNQQQRC